MEEEKPASFWMLFQAALKISRPTGRELSRIEDTLLLQAEYYTHTALKAKTDSMLCHFQSYFEDIKCHPFFWKKGENKVSERVILKERDYHYFCLPDRGRKGG